MAGVLVGPYRFISIRQVHDRDTAPLVSETTEKYKLPYRVNDIFFKALGSHSRMQKHPGSMA